MNWQIIIYLSSASPPYLSPSLSLRVSILVGAFLICCTFFPCIFWRIFIIWRIFSLYYLAHVSSVDSVRLCLHCTYSMRSTYTVWLNVGIRTPWLWWAELTAELDSTVDTNLYTGTATNSISDRSENLIFNKHHNATNPISNKCHNATNIVTDATKFIRRQTS